MIRILFLIILCLFLNSGISQALDVVHPGGVDSIINANSTFFAGNVNPKATLKINNEGVKIWDDGIFVHIVPLFYGTNTITLEETLNGKTQKSIYTIKRNKPSAGKVINIPYEPKEKDIFLYTKTINNSSTVREKPSGSSKRVIDLPKGVVLYLAGKKGDYYKIEAHADSEFWIHKSNIEPPVKVTKKFIAKISKPEHYSDKYYNYTKMAITYPVLYTMTQHGKKLKLTLYNTSDSNKKEKLHENVEFTFEDENQVLGYDVLYEEDKLILRRARVADKINPYTPLYGVRIFIDAGHGGNEKGAVGPTRVYEKDINLAIAKKLVKLLKEEGAIVSYSRLDDKQVKLYDRVNMAKENNAFISLSLHANSLPHGRNPYITHGVETHYYNDNAKVLAFIIQKNLSEDTGLKNNGLRKSSFALNRSTNPISVLIETAYMINPDEYKKLRNEKFQEEIAQSVKKSLGQFMILLKR